MSMEKEGGSSSEFMKRASINQAAAYNFLRKLKELKWIEEGQQKDFPFRREFKLTEKGRKVGGIEGVGRALLRDRYYILIGPVVKLIKM